MTNKEKCLDLIDDVRCTINCEYIHDSILREIDEYLDGIEKFINQSASNPTLSECIKEWEERGFVVSNSDKRIVIKLTHEATDGFIHISKRFKETYMRCVLSYDLIQLLSKTLKALEVEE